MLRLSFGLVIGLLYALYNFGIARAAQSIHVLVGAVALQVVAALCGAVMTGVLWANGTALPVSGRGLLWAGAAGLAVGLAEICSFWFFSWQVPLSVGGPIIVGSWVVFSALLGIVFSSEALGVREWCGIALIVLGAVLLTSRSSAAAG